MTMSVTISFDDTAPVAAEALEPGHVTMSGLVLAAETYDVEGIGFVASTPEEALAVPDDDDGDLVMVRVEYASGEVERHPAGTEVVVLAAVDDELLAVAREAAR